MCGILAISSAREERFDLKTALKAIAHRGPDDSGIFYSEKCDAQLGHARLSIIDLSEAGHQPMPDASGRFVICYNGEVYNYNVLKEYLENKYGNIPFKSTSDTEVILEGFAREGYTFLSKLNGIFALALYDKLDKTLHVLRDPIGIKPLYYTEQNGSFIFCSELKGVLSFDNLKKGLRKQSLADQLAFMYVPEPYTMYEGFFKLEPGLYSVFKEGKRIYQEKLFTHLHQKISFSNENEMVEMFQRTFADAVKRQLIADVPVSLFLSGGLDSSSVAYEAVKSGGKVQTAYTISFSKEDSQFDGQSNDLAYAEKMAKELKLDLQIIKAQPEFISLLPQLLPFLEDGISDPAAINTFLICESARKDGVKVMLSGQGADEYLCGYRRYKAEQMISNMSSLTRIGLQVIDSILPSVVPGKFNAVTRRIKRLAQAANQPVSERLPGYFMWTTPKSIQNYFLDSSEIRPGEGLVSFFKDHENMDTLETMLLADQQFDLLALNLSYSDKMSMAVGVEARVPFLDFEMVKLMNSIPVSYKLKNGQQKYILKKAMESALPHEVIYRPKAGFALPIRSWFRKKSPLFERYFNPERIRKQDIFVSDVFNNMYQEHLSGQKDHSYALFSVLCQQMWLEQTFGI